MMADEWIMGQPVGVDDDHQEWIMGQPHAIAIEEEAGLSLAVAESHYRRLRGDT